MSILLVRELEIKFNKTFLLLMYNGSMKDHSVLCHANMHWLQKCLSNFTYGEAVCNRQKQYVASFVLGVCVFLSCLLESFAKKIKALVQQRCKKQTHQML